MSLHIVRALNAQGHTIGYLWRGKLVEQATSAKVYDSPSAAQRAIKQAENLAAQWVVQPVKAPQSAAAVRGGARPGAGRPSTELLLPVRLRLSEADLALANAIGRGNRTKGIRLALRQHSIQPIVA